MFCTKCGNQLADDDRFCIKCGAAVKGAPQPQNAPEPEAPKGSASDATAHPQGAPEQEAPKAEEMGGTPDPETAKKEAVAKKMEAWKRKVNKIGVIVACIFFIVVLINVAVQGYNGLTHKSRLAETAQGLFIDLLKEEGVNMDRYNIVDIELDEAPVMEDYYIANVSIKAPNGNVEQGKFLVIDQKPWSFWSLLPKSTRFYTFDISAKASFDVESLPESLKSEVTQIRARKRREELEKTFQRSFGSGRRYNW